jgi:hypothetical protein
MWYPNREQWRVIWLWAGTFTFVSVVSLFYYGNPGSLLLAALIDGILWIWKRQKSGNSK